MRRRALTVAWLTALWVVLWRDVSVANVLSGLAVGALVTAAFPRPTDLASRGHRLRPIAAARFLGYFAYKLVEANVILAREILTPTNRIETGIIAVPLPGCSDLVVTIVADAVSLTPGTLTVEVDTGEPPVVYVHVLHLHDIERAREDVRTLTRLVGAALPATGSPPVATGGGV